MPDEATAGLIFASDQANHNFARVLGDLRRSHLSITHRLRSIGRDAAFVADVAAHYPGFPVVANERCGSWYVKPTQKGGSAYFKSTDGHTGQWKFSLRRLNLHLLSLVRASEAGGCIVVDSTRRGKRMPDALSKTIPLWCCVLNRARFPDNADYHALYTPPGVVSASEHSQMLTRVPVFVDGLLGLGVLTFGSEDGDEDGDDNGDGGKRSRKPLRPVWVTPDMPWPDVDGLRDRFDVVLCCTSSRAPEVDGEADSSSDYDYIQGAADDTENWAHGLTPELFWTNHQKLLDTPEADLPALIQAIVTAGTASTAAATATAALTSANSSQSKTWADIAITPFLSAGQWTGASPPAPPQEALSNVCQVVFVRQTTDADTWARSPESLQVGLGKQDKVAGRTLRYALPRICEFVAAFLQRAADDKTSPPPTIRVLCPTGRDISVGTALALLCFCFDEAGTPRTAAASSAPAVFNKDVIRVRLARIMTAMPHANPSRATLQSVNSFLMDYRG
ncbi:tRNA A64-2'-O-ribosylphosphate transferase [Sporothrix curviconia]|uniref:tRNA A64-2'-O-ribosylphosphate transferase n=1 Tax=Sporothrix curviconia TaxID=1260050 RepID=A0ABP0BNQ4_9PEZI